MRFLFLTSFYSSIQHSILNNKWNPKGMPAFYLFLEGLDKKYIEFDCIFIGKNASSVQCLKNTRFTKSTFWIINSEKEKTSFKILDDFWYFKNLNTKVINLLNLNNYDIIYIDRANIGFIPFIDKKYNGKIILRLHGIATLFQDFKSIKAKLFNWYRIFSYRREVDLAIGTRDGTPVAMFFEKYLNKKTPKLIIMNGVKRKKERIEKNNSNIRFLFLGRLEEDKGIVEVLEAFKKIGTDYGAKVELIIVGNGSERNTVKNYCKRYSYIIYRGELNHSELRLLHNDIDVTISINYLGNISNVILESIVNETAIITLKEDKKNFYDIDSNSFLNNNVMYVDRNNVPNDLSRIIIELINDRNTLQSFKDLTKNNLKPQLTTWNYRINKEIEYIKKVFNKEFFER
ncbi:MAG: hypothetical protein CMF96_03670 [Candidatus Marinimicrobia bacterium]|nr:hypothetical protein [Candidatus Neomarinimicrobiota bacterium]